MKRIIAYTLLALASLAGLQARGETSTYFPYPLVPDTISTLQGRSDFLVRHFWDRCDMKRAFSSRARMAEALSHYLSVMPYASADEAYASTTALFKRLEKQPDDLLFFAETARECVHSDTSSIFSDDIYLPFVKAVAANKRIDSKTREEYAKVARRLSNSREGNVIEPFDYTLRGGVPGTFTPDTAAITILFFNDKSIDSSLARTRLDADIMTGQLIRLGIIKIVSVTKMDPSDDWGAVAAFIPQTWTAGAKADIDDHFDIGFFPSFYLLEPGGKLVMKNANVDQVITVINRLIPNTTQQTQANE